VRRQTECNARRTAPQRVNLRGRALSDRAGHLRQATALYLAIIDQLRDRIAFLGWPMWVCDDKAGLQDGYTAKLLHPDTPSGRQAGWAQIQMLVDALYPDGMAFVVIPRSPRRKPYTNRRLTLGLEKLPPHPASVRPKKPRGQDAATVMLVRSLAVRPSRAERSHRTACTEAARLEAVAA
jgi:hypothetical protein